MRAYGYARSIRGEDRVYTKPEKMIMDILVFSTQKGIDLDGVFVDEGYSGFTMERPELSKLKRLIQANAVDILICKDLTRLGCHDAEVSLFLELLRAHQVCLLLIDDREGDNRAGIRLYSHFA